MSLRASMLLLALSVAALAWLTADASLSLERAAGPAGPLPVMLSRPAAEPLGLVIAAHGTSSHKEVFLPLAWELATRGWALAAVDSRTLSTNDGIAVRAREIIAARDLLAGWVPRAKIGFAGHSDGVAPALAAARLAPGGRSPVVALGCTFSADERSGIPLRAYVGALDQVFPLEAVKQACDAAAPQPAVPLVVSWLSDHFLEQYDPVLVPAMASGLVGPGRVGSPVERCAGRIIAFALALLGALFTGARVAVDPRPGLSRGLVIGMLFVWIAGSAAVWPATIALGTLVGVVAGPDALRRGGWIALIAGALMLVKVAGMAPALRSAPAEGLRWLPLTLAWFAIAWVPKAALFGVSVLTATGPSGMLVPPGVLALALVALIWPAALDRLVAVARGRARR